MTNKRPGQKVFFLKHFPGGFIQSKQLLTQHFNTENTGFIWEKTVFENKKKRLFNKSLNSHKGTAVFFRSNTVRHLHSPPGYSSSSFSNTAVCFHVVRKPDY